VAFFDELMFQLEVILDDAVVDYDDLTGAVAMRVRIFFRGPPVSGPARVPDTVHTVQWSYADGFFEVAQFSRGATDFKLAVLADDGDARRIITAVFETPEPVED